MKWNFDDFKPIYFYLFTVKSINKHRWSERKYFSSYIENFVPIKLSLVSFWRT